MMNESITVTVDRLRLTAFHGVLPQERAVGNEFEVTVALRCPLALEGAVTDELAGTINYAEMIDIIKRVMSQPSHLLEHVAWRLRQALLDTYPAIAGGSVKVTKLLPPVDGAQMAGASVSLDWDCSAPT